MSLKNKFAQFKNVRKKELNLPTSEYGVDGSFFVKELNQAEADKYNELLSKGGNLQYAKAVQLILCDENGSLLFNEKDVSELATYPVSVLKEIHNQWFDWIYGEIEAEKKESTIDTTE